MKKWEVVSSKLIFNDRWLKMRANAYRTPAGDIVEPYYIRELPDWVGCMAFDTDLNIIMLKHYRPGADEFLNEMPAGIIETADGDPAAAARRELEEEIGYQGGELFEIGSYWSNPAIHTNRVFSFIALGGKSTKDIQHEAGETMETYMTTLPELIADISRPTDTPQYQGLQVAIVLQAINFIKQSDHPDAIKLRAQIQ